MNTYTRFDSQMHSDLSLRRRGITATRPPTESVESDDPTAYEGGNAGPYGQAALQAAWDKLYRARSILEAEQAHIRDDRIVLQAEVETLEAREQAVSARELRIRQIELQMALLREEEEEEREERESRSTFARITQAPFEIARSVFGSKK
jgi:hypothetical protein